MDVVDQGGRPFALTWCTNVHPAANLAEVTAMLRGPARRIRTNLGVTGEMGLGLWLPGEMVAALTQDQSAREALQAEFVAGRFKLLTANCFPMGHFHDSPVKERVYRPSWAMPERLEYTVNAMRLVAALAPAGATVPVSTLPLGLAGQGEEFMRLATANLITAAFSADRIFNETGVEIVLCPEPEPGCHFEEGSALVAFLANDLAGLAGNGAARNICRRHLGLCLDTCHAAVVGEDVLATLVRARQSGVRVGKLQLSNALEISPISSASLEALAHFQEPIYCHQVQWLAEKGRPLRSFMDLDEAIAALAAGVPPELTSLRVHFHLPLFWEGEGSVRGTGPGQLGALLARGDLLPPVLEVETYSWSVLPELVGTRGLEEGIGAELRWVETHLI